MASESPEPYGVTAARIAAYGAAEGPCTCGERRGHTGWLLCALSPKAGQDIKAHPREEPKCPRCNDTGWCCAGQPDAHRCRCGAVPREEKK